MGYIMLLVNRGGFDDKAARNPRWNTIPDAPSPKEWWKMNDATNSFSIFAGVMIIKRQYGTIPWFSLKETSCWVARMLSSSTSLPLPVTGICLVTKVTAFSRLISESLAKYGSFESSPITMDERAGWRSMTIASAEKIAAL